MNIKICVGSSCHVKGSYDVIERLKEILAKYDVADLVNLQACFCLGFCANGVSLKVDGMDAPTIERLGEESIFVHNASSENIEDLFKQEIFPLLSR